MRLINRNDIENWSESYDSKGKFPLFVSKLIRATTVQSTFIEIPTGSATFVGGWDAIVECPQATAYVPQGTSLWEFGTEAGVNKKANEDYAKRTKNTLGYTAKESTFIFATPRFWKNKDKWKTEKMKDGVWKDIKVYDSRNFEEWLDTALAVSRSFSASIGRYPSDGILTPEEFWDEWSIGPKITLSPSAVISGREREKQMLLDFLKGTAAIKGVKAATKNEAVAFIVACAKEFDNVENDRFFSKTLIVDTVANYRAIRINNAHPLNLIPRFEDSQPLYAAVSKGHHVIVPLAPDDTFNQEIIELPSIDRKGQVASLIKSGLSENDAENFSRESGRNITILKKLLGFSENKVKWLDAPNLSELTPAMLLGRWSEQHSGDRELIERLSGESFDTYMAKMQVWKAVEEPPIMQIGEFWRLISPLDCWANLSRLVSKKEIDSISDCLLFVFFENDRQRGDISIKEHFVNHNTRFSHWAKEGLIQSLILLSLYGDKLKISNHNCADLVSNTIDKLLSNAPADLWRELNSHMPLIAEASPESFLTAVRNSIAGDRSIMQMFIEENDSFSPQSEHTGLLWALEGLSWMPEYLEESTLILAKLTELDPGGKLSNRPFASLIEIFKPWHFQTFADINERIDALSKIAKEEKDVAWKLYRLLLWRPNDSAHPTYKLRWRIFEKSINTDLNKSWPEAEITYHKLVDMLISLFDFTEQKLSDLIESSQYLLDSKDRIKILEFTRKNYSRVNMQNNVPWNTLREVISFRRGHPNPNSRLSEQELQQYEKLMEDMTPKDLIAKNIWLFEEQWPEFPSERFQNLSYQEQQEVIDDRRSTAMREIIEAGGVESVIELTKKIKNGVALGDSLGRVSKGDDENLLNKISNLLGSNLETSAQFASAFYFRMRHIYGDQWLFNQYYQLKKNDLSPSVLAKMFIPLFPSKEIWDFLDEVGNEEIRNEYWLNMTARFFNFVQDQKIRGVNILISYKRFIAAIHIISHHPENVPTELIVELLKRTATESSNDLEYDRLDRYEIEDLFNILDERKDIDHSLLFELEWLYLSILAAYGSNRKPKLLFEELAKNPKFFIDALKLAVLPKNRELLKEERKGLDKSMVKQQAEQAFKLLNSWKTIPGTVNEDHIDRSKLNAWIDEARQLAKDVDRADIGDAIIGQMLAQYPEKKDVVVWPPDEISEVIERINTDSLKRNFSAAIFNKRGSSVRAAFEGGNIERGHAEYFMRLSEYHKGKHPNVYKVLFNISKGYLADAKRMDEEATREELDV